MSQHLAFLSYYFPWTLVGTLLIALIFGVLGVVIFRHAMKKAAAPPPPPEPEEIKTHPWREKFREILGKYGYFPTDELSKSFVYALKTLHAFVGGREFRYHTPWYLMVGAEDAGKTSVLQSLGLDLPIGKPHFGEAEGQKYLLDWWFFNHGTVLDLDGELFNSATKAYEEKWRSFLDLLVHHRPKRPLDGIVLTLPVTDLDPDASDDEIALRAQKIYTKLWQIQKKTGLQLPVYVIITKCDQVTGFSGFWSSVPEAKKQDMFGWSSGYSLDAAYQPYWLDQAFDSMSQQLYRIQQDILVNETATQDQHDAIFSFPKNFSLLQEKLQVYIDRLFQESGFHETFFFRGVYFTGLDEDKVGQSPQQAPERINQIESILGVSRVGASLLSNPNEIAFGSSQEARVPDSIMFVDKLFEQKIFHEMGVARPLSREFLADTRAMKVAKIGVASASIVGTLGLLKANDYLHQARLALMPALVQVDVALKRTAGADADDEVGRIIFDDQAQILLDTMSKIGNHQLFSMFVPASWFSSINDSIRDVVTIAYDDVILRSMQRELNFKATQIVSLDSHPLLAEIPSGTLNPLNTQEFSKLHSYLAQLQMLESVAKKFNALGANSDLQEVGFIIKYLFNFTMPESFYENASYFQSALKNTRVHVFEFDAYAPNATDKLKRYYDEFEVAAFNPEKLIPGLQGLLDNFYDFQVNRVHQGVSLSVVRALNRDLDLTIQSMQSPALQWIEADDFEPGPAYASMLSYVAGSNFFGQDVASQLIQETNSAFQKFKSQLMSYGSPLIHGTLFSVNAGRLSSQPSSGVLKISEALDKFFSQPFMNETPQSQIITTVPIGSILLWDSLRLLDATKLVDQFNDFQNEELLTLPNELQPIMQQVGRESLIENLITILSDAEIFAAAPIATSVLSPEDALLSQVQNYRATSSYILHIISSLRSNNANEAYGKMRSLLTSQYYSLLKRIDGIFEADYPYAIKGNSFGWWNGEEGAALEAFGVDNTIDLNTYLTLQRERVTYLAQEFAEPVVNFLNELHQTGMPGNLPLVNRWERILEEIQGYAKKAPGNSILALEDFVKKDLNQVTLSTCPLFLQKLTYISPSDFFARKQLSLESLLKKQCTDLSGVVSQDAYQQVASFFNANLAGLFPFADPQVMESADPEMIREFYDMMDAYGVNIKSTLAQAKGLGDKGKRALEFITKMESIRELFGAYLDPSAGIDTPSFAFTVDFRVNREHEQYGNQIIDWFVLTEDDRIDIHSAEKKGFWRYGEPLTVGFDWAFNSPIQPSDSDDANMQVSGSLVNFSYQDPWALLRLMRLHESQPSDFSKLKDLDPFTLRFIIPLTDVVQPNDAPCPNQAKVFVRLLVAPLTAEQNKKVQKAESSTPEKAPQIKIGKPVKNSSFPTTAPLLNARPTQTYGGW